MAAEKTKQKGGLRAWFRQIVRIFKRRNDKISSGSAGQADDAPSPRSNLTTAEKRMIMRAMRGHQWYVCRQNHPYLVGNCGTPLELAVCPTCGDVIGGTGYAPTNTCGLAKGSQPIRGIF